MRASIKTLFPERECVALVRPMSDEKELAAMDALPEARLRPEFRQVIRRAALAAAWSPPAVRDQLHTALGLWVTICDAGMVTSHGPVCLLIVRAGRIWYGPVLGLCINKYFTIMPCCECRLRWVHVQGMEQLVALIGKRALPKQYRGQYMTGAALAGFAQVRCSAAVPAEPSCCCTALLTA